MSNANNQSDYINELYLYFNYLEANNNSSPIVIANMVIWMLMALPLMLLITILFSLILLILPRRRRDTKESHGEVCIARTFATLNKLSFLKAKSVRFFCEAPFDLKTVPNLYNLPFSYRISAFFRVFSIFMYDIWLLSFEVSKHISLSKSIKVIRLYLLRLPHKVNFSSYLEQFIYYYQPDTLITGNKEDRFALSEQSICMAYGVELVCFPHGLEYAMKLPRGVVGNKFYCYSDSTRKHYEKIYKDTKQQFLFSPEVVAKLLGKKNAGTKPHKPKIIFFPESRGKDVNYLIVSELLMQGIKLHLKPHPSDSVEEYVKLGVKTDNIIDDFDEAIVGNIVLARKSTVLLEALYSGSAACALLFDELDDKSFHEQFPSLWDPRIGQAKDVQGFMAWLASEEARSKFSVL